MDSSFLLTIVAAAIGLLTLLRSFGLSTLLRKLRFHQDNSSSSSPSSSLSPISVPPPSSSHIWTHDVFPSFRGEDVRRDFFSHIQMELERKGITSFFDSEIERGESIGPELIKAIRGSKIALILISRNYASSKWCLDELVEIMKCREELGQTVIAIFYKVDPSDVKKQAGDFGRVFNKTCAGKTKECTERWRQALANVATIAGYHSSNWDNEAAMIKKISTDISSMLNNFTPSNDFDGLVGMGAHWEKIEPLLCLGSDEVRMIGIWGPPGIGKTTISRFAYNQLSNSFQLSVFMDDLKANHTRLSSDDYSLKLQLQQLFMSQITDNKDMVVSHLGVASNRLKDKKVLVVLDGVDKLVQLDAIAKETRWFGPGSRIVITTQDQGLLKAHGIDHIYRVNLPQYDEALQILCMYAFGQKSPKDGFKELASEVKNLAGRLPLGLRVMGSHFRGRSKQEWEKLLPRLESSLDTNIGSILKFSYDALDEEDKELFLHISCFFNDEKLKRVEEQLEKKFLEVGQRLYVLAEKSLISFCTSDSYIRMHSLLVKLGREIVRKQSIEPGQRQFLVDKKEICEVLIGDAAGGKSIIGINFNSDGEELDISERAFEEMSNLQFLRVGGRSYNLKLWQGLNYLPRKLQIIDWRYFPMTCFPIVNLEFLGVLRMHCSKLEKLWKGIKLLQNLKEMDLWCSLNLKELPDLSTATNLEKLILGSCSSLLQLPSTIGNATNLRILNLSHCSSMVKLPSSIGNATNLENLLLNYCSNLVEIPLSIGTLQKLRRFCLHQCSKLQVLPININLESLDELDLTDCSMLKSFPEISTNIRYLLLIGTAIEEVSPSIRSWTRLEELHMSYLGNLEVFPQAFDIITGFDNVKLQKVPRWVPLVYRLKLERLLRMARICRWSSRTHVLEVGLCITDRKFICLLVPCWNPDRRYWYSSC